MTSAVLDAIDNSDFIHLSSQHIQVLSWLYNNTPKSEAVLAQSRVWEAFPENGDLTDVLMAAGTPIEAIENHDAQMVLPLELFRQRPTYLLKVRGDSMQDIGIMDGDIIAVRKTESAGEGKIVVARVDNEVTVKRLKVEKDRVGTWPTASRGEGPQRNQSCQHFLLDFQPSEP